MQTRIGSCLGESKVEPLLELCSGISRDHSAKRAKNFPPLDAVSKIEDEIMVRMSHIHLKFISSLTRLTMYTAYIA